MFTVRDGGSRNGAQMTVRRMLPYIVSELARADVITEVLPILLHVGANIKSNDEYKEKVNIEKRGVHG